MKHTYFLSYIVGGLLVLQATSCKKYLETKADQNLSTPSTLADLQLLLDNTGLNRSVSAINSSSDEYYLLYDDWLSIWNGGEVPYKSHIWDPTLDDPEDWFILYTTVLYANTILESLEKIPATGKEKTWNSIKGSALFYRAHSFYLLAQMFAPPYDKNSAREDLGVPLRLSADFNDPTIRSTVQQTYDQIFKDLNDAVTLVPDLPLHKTRVGKAAIYAMLARMYLLTGMYPEAKGNAEACLQLQGALMDFNELDPFADTPIPLFNAEVIFYITTSDPLNIYDWIVMADTSLYNSFNEFDLRKKVFFRENANGSHYFKGSYNNSIYEMFNGLATDEVYLILAESEARLGNKLKSLEQLNKLLSKRWHKDHFVPVDAADANEALHLVIQERRKELIYRGLRWPDLRRLNKEPEFAVTLTRFSGAHTYTLPPNDLRYTLLIPQKVIAFSGIPQNPR